MAAKVSLPVVQPEIGKDSIISVMDAGFPVLKGNDPEHLACGACGDVLAWNLSSETVRKMFIVVHRLLFRCRCGALNMVPAEAGA